MIKEIINWLIDKWFWILVFIALNLYMILDFKIFRHFRTDI